VSAITASSISLYLDKIEVGTGPEGTAFDGVNLWVTNRNSGTVSKVRIEPSFP
jgi:DNA-binding beta-propeller fold protein YncE